MNDYDAFSGRLMGGERLQWSGRPRQGIVFYPADALLIPFSLLWGGFAIFWEASVLVPADDSEGGVIGAFMAVWGIPFVLVGLYMIFGRFFFDAWWRSRTHYGVTDRRALILRGDRFTAVDLGKMDTVRLKGGVAGGKGTIEFGSTPAWGILSSRSWGMWTPSMSTQPAFIGIEDAQRVFNLIESARARAL